MTIHKCLIINQVKKRCNRHNCNQIKLIIIKVKIRYICDQFSAVQFFQQNTSNIGVFFSIHVP